MGYDIHMMTRKDFVAIAAVLDANMADVNLVADMADMLADDNPNFDRARFMDAATGRIYKRIKFDKAIIEQERKG